MMKAVIMAGGRGTRISQVASDIPKPMISICGKPVLQREIECLRNQGYQDLIITVSYLAHVIQDYFGDGSKFGVKISYYLEEKPLGNAGALFELKDILDDDFLLLNADSVFDVDFKRFEEFHRKHGGLATLFTHPNSHPYDSGLVFCNDDFRVTKWLSKEDERPRWYKNRVNAGLHILSPKLLKRRPATEKVDLDRQILKPLAGSGFLYCYDSSEYVKDMGTPDRLAKVEKDYKDGIVESKRLSNKQKAIFLDRDGTINKYVGFLRREDDLELLPGACDAIKKINDSGYLAIVVTNQPVIARGEVTIPQLTEIHSKLETLLCDGGAYLDAIYYCHHHPDKGFDGEIPELKIDCQCRKPKPGLLLKAAEDFNIDFFSSWMIGDSDSDMIAGQAAGCQTVLLNNGLTLLDAVEKILSGDIV